MCVSGDFKAGSPMPPAPSDEKRVGWLVLFPRRRVSRSPVCVLLMGLARWQLHRTGKSPRVAEGRQRSAVSACIVSLSIFALLTGNRPIPGRVSFGLCLATAKHCARNVGVNGVDRSTMSQEFFLVFFRVDWLISSTVRGCVAQPPEAVPQPCALQERCALTLRQEGVPCAIGELFAWAWSFQRPKNRSPFGHLCRHGLLPGTAQAPLCFATSV